MVCKNDRLIMTVPEPGLFFMHVTQRFASYVYIDST